MSGKTHAQDAGTQKTGRFRRLARGFASLATFSVNVGMAAAAVVIGVTTIQMRAAERPDVQPAPLTEVITINPDFQTGYDVTRSFVGRLEPARRTDLGFELSGTVREIQVDEGGSVQKGDIIAVLDTRSLEAERRRQQANRQATESDRELAQLTLDRRTKLKDSGHVSDQVLDEARLSLSRLDASLAQIDAAIEAIEISLDKSVLRAPFDGHIGERLLDEGATVAPGQAVLRVLESARPTVRIGLAPEVVDRLQHEDTYEIRIGDVIYAAALSGLRPDLETRTRTVESLFELENSTAAPGFGRLAELSLTERIASEGYWVPTTALKEGPRGLWTLLTVVSLSSEGAAVEYKVAREAVEVIHADGGRSFVRGTISKNSVIVAKGVHRVVTGQSVRLASSGV
ncbi:efflux RND transporter periplasmic adaptor subunit [Roseibium porphyridii]|uniref:Efflux RND transporter periplasmic adaptor subunit n=1 Tax=Roseibium porphyridii TaxID=2866279 RepID=A0ABY8F1I0_9HYPH|nr:efflux RND transporter periplasmic adaptor subunit [Roseibium sp. KMA01]WFE89305.1 efflux RND transporter periplasmic adaptor subunit [Roseibium sp. KMA01]